MQNHRQMMPRLKFTLVFKIDIDTNFHQNFSKSSNIVFKERQSLTTNLIVVNDYNFTQYLFIGYKL